jgi:hypothetical protein
MPRAVKKLGCSTTARSAESSKSGRWLGPLSHCFHWEEPGAGTSARGSIVLAFRTGDRLPGCMSWVRARRHGRRLLLRILV